MALQQQAILRNQVVDPFLVELRVSCMEPFAVKPRAKAPIAVIGRSSTKRRTGPSSNALSLFR